MERRKIDDLTGAQLEGFRKFFVVFLSFYGCLGFFYFPFSPFSIRSFDMKYRFCINNFQIINDPIFLVSADFFQKLPQPRVYFVSLYLNSCSIRWRQCEGSRLAQQSLTRELRLLIMVDNFNHRLRNHSCRPYFVPVNNNGINQRVSLQSVAFIVTQGKLIYLFVLIRYKI